MRRGTLAAIAEIAASLAVTAWIGGIVALGAFTARIVFAELPRGMAAPTMSHIFGSFDGVIVIALCLVAAAAVARYVALGMATRADRIFMGAAGALLALGILDVAWVHPQIRAMFEAGRTLEPEFARLHTLSTRSANLEVVAAALMFVALAFSRRGGALRPASGRADGERAANERAANEGAANEGAASQGAASQGAANQGAASQGAASEGAANEGAANERARSAGGATSEGAARE
jgi:hypothetical protein